MSRLILARHAETVWHAENRYAGQSDIALTAQGQAQAAQLGQWAATAGLTAIWASTLRRAQETAAPAAAATSLTVQTDERLIELSFGKAEGLTVEEIRARFPSEQEAFFRDPAAFPLPGGEPPAHAAARGVAALVSIAQNQPQGRTLVVAHSALLRVVLCRLLGISLSSYRVALPGMANCALNEIELSQDRFSLLSFNVPLPRC